MGFFKSLIPFVFKKNYYILRFSSFARSGNIKLLYTFITLFLCLNNYEYYLLYLISSISWGAIEMFLQVIGVRKISSMFLTWNNKEYTIIKPFNYLLQGSMEAGFIIIFGIYFCDNPEYLNISLLLIFFHTLILSYNQDISEIHSKRLINKEFALLFLSLITIIDIIYIYTFRDFRSIKILFNMILVGTFWTLPHVIMKTRRVITDTNINFLEIFIILAFDVIIEIGFMYIPFYFITKLLI